MANVGRKNSWTPTTIPDMLISCFSLSLLGVLAVSAILFIVMGILVTMFFPQIIDNFIYKVILDLRRLLVPFIVQWRHAPFLSSLEQHTTTQKRDAKRKWVKLTERQNFHLLYCWRSCKTFSVFDLIGRLKGKCLSRVTRCLLLLLLPNLIYI